MPFNYRTDPVPVGYTVVNGELVPGSTYNAPTTSATHELALKYSERDIQSLLGATKTNTLTQEQLKAGLSVENVTPPDSDVTRIFGSKSDPKLANKIARENPVRYAHLRKRAVELQILA